MATPEEVAAAQSSMRPFRVLPGGASAIPEEWYAAAIMVAALVGLVAIRRGLGKEGRTMASGTAAFVFLFYYLIVTAMLRIVASHVAARGDTPVARGIAFYA